MSQETFRRIGLHVRNICLLMVASACVCAAQNGSTVLGTGTVVTGQCSGHDREPGCVLPGLFGPGGLTRAQSRIFALRSLYRFGANHFEPHSQQRHRHTTCDPAYHFAFVRLYIQIRQRRGCICTNHNEFRTDLHRAGRDNRSRQILFRGELSAIQVQQSGRHRP